MVIQIFNLSFYAKQNKTNKHILIQNTSMLTIFKTLSIILYSYACGAEYVREDARTRLEPLGITWLSQYGG